MLKAPNDFVTLLALNCRWKLTKHVRAIHVSKPMLNAMGVPMALQRLYRQPTHSQKPNIFVTSIPNLDTAATKCLAMQPGSLFYLDNSHALVVSAFASSAS